MLLLKFQPSFEAGWKIWSTKLNENVFFSDDRRWNMKKNQPEMVDPN